jgi:dipeptidyl aminopeptidase/acylaminoacyl peptidase
MGIRKLSGILLTVMSLSAGMAVAADVPLIPRSALFGNPVRTQARLSPDARYVSFLAPRDGVLNVWLAPYGKLDEAKPITNDRKRGIREHFWAANGRHVLYLQDEGGDENWRVYSVDVESGKQLDLTPFKDVQAQVVGLSHERPDYVLVGLNDRAPEWHDLHLIDVRTGERQLVELNEQEFAGYLADLQLQPRLALKTLPEGGGQLFRRTEGKWEKFLEYGQEDSLTTQPLVIEGNGRNALMVSAVNRDKAALVRIDLATGKETVIGQSDKADVSGVWTHPRTHEPQAYTVEYLRTELKPLTPDVKPDIERLQNALGPQFEVTSRTLDDRKWIVVVDDPVKVLSTYLYERDGGTITKLFDQRPELANAPLQPMQTHEIKSRDGQTLTAYVTLPAGAKGPVPMVLNVHGGPWARDAYGFDPEHQWLANRGYAVLSVNFRGSTGFGKSFINAGDHEWGRKMHDDLIDAVEWAVNNKIAQRDKVAIYGGSYGGYATLVGMTFTPDTFACGVDIVGPSNLETLLASIPPYWKAFFDDMARRIGDPRTEEGRKLLAERSPIHYVERIKRPLLIAQGANDPRVKKAESDQIVEAMKRKNLRVTYVLYPDEGHGFARPQNRLSFYAVTEGFLASCLGGRFEPIGEDFAGSSLQVLEGAEHVPGLVQALRALEASPEARSDPESAEQSKRH